MSSVPAPQSAPAPSAPVAPAWHTMLLLLVLAAGSVLSAYEQGFPNAHLANVSWRMSGYLTVIVEEWFLVLLIWPALRSRGVSLGSLISGRWQTLRSFFVDIALGIGTVVVAVLLLGVLPGHFGVKLPSSLGHVTPRTWPELAVWLALSASGGFCEEIVFRGYLQRQFQAWTRSGILAVVLQGAVFGLAHGYYFLLMTLIAAHGCLLGLLAYWRRSLRPGMLAHWLQDSLGGITAFLS
jgi:uncharacterized protein